jgi:hypothetical protein
MKMRAAATQLICLIVVSLLSGCSGLNAAFPLIATSLAPTPEPAKPTARPTRTPRPATATTQATRRPPTRTPSPTRTPIANALPTLTPNSDATPDIVAAVFITETTNDGWTRFASDDEGFAISLPESWVKINVSQNELKAGLSEISPKMAEQLGDTITQQFREGLKFFALDSDLSKSDANFSANVNVLKTPITGRPALRLVLQQAVVSLQQVSGIRGNITQRQVRLKQSGTAGLLGYTLNFTNTNGEPIPTQVRQYVFVVDNALIIVTLGATEKQLSDYESVFDDIANRFEVLKK